MKYNRNKPGSAQYLECVRHFDQAAGGAALVDGKVMKCLLYTSAQIQKFHRGKSETWQAAQCIPTRAVQVSMMQEVFGLGDGGRNKFGLPALPTRVRVLLDTSPLKAKNNCTVLYHWFVRIYRFLYTVVANLLWFLYISIQAAVCRGHLSLEAGRGWS